MTVIEQDFHSIDIHPIDMVETLAQQCEWEFDRSGEDQIAMVVEASWRAYSINLAWSGYDDMLRLVCTFDLTPPTEQLDEFYRLLNMVNDRVWCGSFTLWPEHKLMAFRFGLTLGGGATATPEQIEAMILSAVGLSERYYPAFQLIGWSNQTPEDALTVAIEEAYGTA